MSPFVEIECTSFAVLKDTVKVNPPLSKRSDPPSLKLRRGRDACRYRKVTERSHRTRETFFVRELKSAAAKQIWICRLGSSNLNPLPSAPLPEQRVQPALPWFASDNRRRALAVASSLPATGS